MIDDEKQKIKEELSALCLQFGLHPDTFDNEEIIEQAFQRRKEPSSQLS
jgi:hypothetical protein